jgi:phospholipase C
MHFGDARRPEGCTMRNVFMHKTLKVLGLVAGVAAALPLPKLFAATVALADEPATKTPIKHVIVILGENRSFDHIFATYKPVSGDTISNLLSKGIVNADGTPGPHYAEAVQVQAAATKLYQLSPPKTGPYAILPPALAGGPATPWLCQTIGVKTGSSCLTEANLAAALKIENDVADDYRPYLLTGGTGQDPKQPDRRIRYAGKDASHLPPGPYQLTSPSLPYDSYTANPVHRFYQMWQQQDCDAGTTTKANPSGCKSDLFAFVEVSVGGSSNGKAQPAGFNDMTTGEGAAALGFYNIQAGDAPYLKELADTYAMSDNYHQAALGGTGANHIMLGTGDMIWYSDGQGHPAVPPHAIVDPQNPATLDEIENPNPQPGSNNYYVQDGYGGGTGSPTAAPANPNYGGGSYSLCADTTQPGVGAVRDYLAVLERKIDPHCEPGHYYLLNNYDPGYFGDGSNAAIDKDPHNTVFTVPPSTLRTIGDALNEKFIAWAYYGEDWNRYLNDKYGQGWKTGTDEYCNICNWVQYATSIMTDRAVRQAHLKDTTDLYAGIADGALPAVSYVKPSGLLDGHPASSKLNLFEGFAKKIIDAVKANPQLWADTAIFVTFDEGGGYWDSGYVQPLDFFGDGTRTPMIVVSKYSMGGHISHSYTDHVSVLKFIEANWGIAPLTERSRDNLPNPIVDAENPYVPQNSPAIGDMMDLFRF